MLVIGCIQFSVVSIICRSKIQGPGEVMVLSFSAKTNSKIVDIYREDSRCSVQCWVGCIWWQRCGTVWDWATTGGRGLHNGAASNIDISTTQKFIWLAINKSFSNCNKQLCDQWTLSKAKTIAYCILKIYLTYPGPQHGIGQALVKCDSGQWWCKISHFSNIDEVGCPAVFKVSPLYVGQPCQI